MKAYSLAAVVLGAALLLGAVFAVPLFVHGQETDLRTSIRAALLSDPRTEKLSAAEMDAMVEILSAEAEKQGITSSDIQWRPQAESTFTNTAADESVSCGNIPGFLCALNTAFGFNGSDPTIAIGLGITSAILIVIIGLMLEMKRRAARAVVPPASSFTPPPSFQ